MWHLVCGDVAAEGVTRVIGEAAAARALRVLRDDLAVGPLVDVETPPCTARTQFWLDVWPTAVPLRPDFGTGLSADADWLAALKRQDQPVTVWHGDSCSEQLLLARVAAALEGTDLPLWEVPCGTGDSSVETRRAVGMIDPAGLGAYFLPKQVDAGRKASLASQWRSAVAGNADVRRWQKGDFQGEDHRKVDAILLGACTADWQPLARVMAELMGQSDGFFVTDFFALWRAQELAAEGRLELDGTAGQHGYGGLTVRLS
ncbi:DUF1835 domain-containing protein [Pseudomonas sp. JM0905a]|uniref:DUF3658 domain-containing protein n=1 Tax=Pseudomonas sp. JM0905a TaxID=2772484 RepID=UPI0016863661|nr:DUF3658 domain-containing protein [Pseudomonas sp. JM0905a]MBD2836895.1 DUF1835 domain-containing protein [Pseudomonas sp. JM0905a]